jgi:ABC-2 type transport system permease protein
MNKILLITRREYISRVKKKSFIIMTILGPLLLAIFYAGIIYFSISDRFDDTTKLITVVDETGMFIGKIPDSKTLKFVYSDKSFEEEKKNLGNSEHTSLLLIPRDINLEKTSVELHSADQPSLGTKSYIVNKMEQAVRNKRLAELGIRQGTIDSTKTTVQIETRLASGETSSTELSTAIGFACAFLIYFFIFIYGIQVMKGVIEEKTNRIVEIIISSVRPIQLMLGKIFGIALVAFTQFMIWVVLSFFLITIVTAFFGKEMTSKNKMSQVQTLSKEMEHVKIEAESKKVDFDKIRSSLDTINPPLVIGMFLFYFIGGYLFYSALFAAVGAAVDNDTETQQFMLPITLPLVFAFVVAQASVVNNPDGSLAFWLSMIPFTSPIVMMVRIPFHVPVEELLLSMFFMVAGFIFTTWLAAKIYRTGILLYGKKVTYKELGKWLFYK